MEHENRATEAALMYAGGMTFSEVAEKLEVVKSYATTLVKKGILELKGREESPPTETETQPATHQAVEIDPNVLLRDAQHSVLPNYLLPESYVLETDGIGKKIVLTPGALVIYDLWRGDGYSGDLSDFIEMCIQQQYLTRRPADRIM